MLLNSTQVTPRSQREEESLLLRRKIEELNRDTVHLIAEAGETNPRIETAIGADQVSPLKELLGHYPVGGMGEFHRLVLLLQLVGTKVNKELAPPPFAWRYSGVLACHQQSSFWLHFILHTSKACVSAGHLFPEAASYEC